MRRNLAFLSAGILFFSTAAVAQMVESKVRASNGVVVDVNSDDFAGRFEYSAPSIDFNTTNGGNGVVLVAKVRRNGSLGKLHIQGFVVYSGDWQYFTSAVYKGGAPVNYTRTNADVVSCRRSCTFSENFRIEITPQEIAKHSENGIVAIQIRGSKSGSTGIINVPVRYFEAVNEVAK